MCDAKYCFTLVDVGSYGRENDAAILSESAFGKLFDAGPSGLNIPSPRLVGNFRLPYVLIGDEIFPLKPWLMKPYPGRSLDEPRQVYNYRLSRARSTIENSFGILSAWWCIFSVPIHANVETVELITKAAICLHNYLQLTDNAFYMPSGFVDSENADSSLSPGCGVVYRKNKTHTGEVTQVYLIDVRPTLQNRKAWSLKFCCHGSYDVNADRK